MISSSNAIVQVKLLIKNVLGTCVSTIVSLCTSPRVYTLQDKDYTLAGIDDCTTIATSITNSKFAQTIENYNPFSSNHFTDSVTTNIFCGRGSTLHCSVNGVYDPNLGYIFSDLNFEKYNYGFYGSDGDAPKTLLISLQTNGFASPTSGLIYAEGRLLLNFYYYGVPQTITGRVKLWSYGSPYWLDVTVNSINYSTFEVVIPTGTNFVTDIELTFTTAPAAGAFHVSGVIQWCLTQIQYQGVRIAAGQGGLLTSAGGYLGGWITTGINSYFYQGIAIYPSSLQSTPRQGLFEYDGASNPYFTDNVSRKRLAYLTDIPAAQVITYPTNTATSINLTTALGTNLALTVLSGLAFATGDNYRIYSAANDANYIECGFVSYSVATLTVLVYFVRGTATFTDGVITKSTGTFSAYLTADLTRNVNTIYHIPQFNLFAEAGVMYNIKVVGSYTSNATNNGAYLGVTSGVAANYLVGKLWMANTNTNNTGETNVSMNTSLRAIALSAVSANATQMACGMDYNVIFPSNTNCYVDFSCYPTSGQASNLIAGTSIIITRLK